MPADSRTLHLEESAYEAFYAMRTKLNLGVSQAVELLLTPGARLPRARLGTGGRVVNVDPVQLAALVRSWIGSQETLADQLGVTQKAVSAWATGRSLPRRGPFCALVELFGIDESELLCD